jgi:hypothetical protein
MFPGFEAYSTILYNLVFCIYIILNQGKKAPAVLFEDLN